MYSSELDYYVYEDRLVLGIQIGNTFLIGCSYFRMEYEDSIITGMGITRLDIDELKHIAIIPTEEPGILVDKQSLIDAFPTPIKESIFRPELQLFIKIYSLWYLEKIPLEYLNLAKDISKKSLRSYTTEESLDFVSKTLNSLGALPYNQTGQS